MGITASNTAANIFGLGKTAAASSASNEDRLPAKYWLNTGIPKTIKNEEGENEVIFVSLSKGQPLDTMEVYDVTKVRSPKMRKLRAAQNNLHAQFMAAAEKLAPGETTYVTVQVEIRAVGAEETAPVDDENELIVTLDFA